jgi:hypothetical protein
MPVGVFDVCALVGFFASCRQQPGQSGKVVGGHGQDEPRPDAFNTAIHSLCHSADGFRPAERLFDPLPVLLGLGVTLIPGGSAIDC